GGRWTSGVSGAWAFAGARAGGARDGGAQDTGSPRAAAWPRGDPERPTRARARAAGGRRRGARAIITPARPTRGRSRPVRRPAAEGATPVIAQAHVPPAGTTLERPVKPGAEGAWGQACAGP